MPERQFHPIFQLFSAAGLQRPAIPDDAHLVAYGHRIASSKPVAGLRLEASSGPRGIDAEVVVAAGVQLQRPVHLCFGLYGALAEQDVRMTLTLEPGASATLWSHCLFSTPQRARHAMQGMFRLMEGASLNYQEAHFHGSSGAIEVSPQARVELGRGARLRADFELLRGRVGKLAIDYRVDVGEAAIAELVTRAYGFGVDEISIDEQLRLAGEGARGLLKTRVAVRDDAQARVAGRIEGLAAGARGHVDCMEVVRDRARACAVPEVRVSHPQAKVTHEAAIGSVDSRQLETLMARGLAPDEAVDLIVRGMLA